MHFIDSIKFSSSQVHATVHSSALQLGICTDNAISSCVRSIDGFSHNMSFTSKPRAIRSSLARHFLFVISHCQVCLSHLLWIRQDRVCLFLRLCRMLHRHSSSFLPSFFYTRRNGVHNPYNQLSRMFLLRYLRRDLTFVSPSVERASTNCSPALPRIKLWGFDGSPTLRNSMSQESLPEKSSRHSPHQCSPWCQRNELTCLLVFISKHSVAPSDSSFVSSASWFLEKQISPRAPCHGPCDAYFCAVRPSLLIWNGLSIHAQ